MERARLRTDGQRDGRNHGPTALRKDGHKKKKQRTNERTNERTNTRPSLPFLSLSLSLFTAVSPRNLSRIPPPATIGEKERHPVDNCEEGDKPPFGRGGSFHLETNW